MRPTLEVGDFILVNKFVYGMRLPIIEQKIIPLGDPKRGDVVVFRYPLNPSQDFIKRVIGVGGDVGGLQGQAADRQRRALAEKPDGTYGYLEGLRFEIARRVRRDRRHGAGPEGARHRDGDPTMPPVIPGAGASVSRDARTAITIRTAAASRARCRRATIS